MKSIALLLTLAFMACTDSDEVLPPDGGFSGHHTACENYRIVKTTRDSTGFLAIEDEVDFSGDSLYEQNLAVPGSARIWRQKYQNPYDFASWFCGNGGWRIIPDQRGSWEATQGMLQIKVYGFVRDTTIGSQGPVVSTAYFLEATLKNVVFEDGFRIDSLHIDSARGGWFPPPRF